MSETEFHYAEPTGEPTPDEAASAADSSVVGSSTPEWRDEVAAKMQQYRSRRKTRGPKYPSLQLPFERPEPSRSAPLEAASRSSLAFDHAIAEPLPLEPARLPDEPLFFLAEPLRGQSRGASQNAQPAPVAAAPIIPAAVATNLIEFPRYSTPAIDWDELAEPVIDRPRILEAPELVPPQPALGGILLEAPAENDLGVNAEARPQPASIRRRLLANALDVVFVGVVAALGGWIFYQLAHELPPRPQLLLASALVSSIFWLSYQYLLMVCAGGTLGQRACKLYLVSFDGSVPNVAERRWRLLAALLSAAAVMLGYAWMFLDEDGLCWHDRISRTYLRRVKTENL